MKQNIEICSGCIARSTEARAESPVESRKLFLTEVQAALTARRPDVEWNLSTVSCMRFCPENKLSIVVLNRMGMTRGSAVDTIVEDILIRIDRP
ncbi:hypothetical protein ACNH6C_08630 [Bdellovibrio bacteriovorus]|uniref:hypothetical protein n=1 Tax=Bdellovibrio bacteriovorus TaxID=959 RepID=UPI003A7F8676